MKKAGTIMAALCLFLLLTGAALGKDSSQSVEIKAPASRVWAVLIDVNHWADDNPAVRKSELIGGNGESVGSVIQYYPVVGKVKPVKLEVTITVSEKNARLEYKGGAAGVDMVMGFELREKDGVTTLTNYEHARGYTVNLVSQQNMDAEHRQWAEAVKKRVEGSGK
jgi:hypothetical protein